MGPGLAHSHDMPNIPPAIPLESPPPVDPAREAPAGHEAAPRSPEQPATMHRAEDDAEARARSRDFSEQSPKPSQE